MSAAGDDAGRSVEPAAHLREIGRSLPVRRRRRDRTTGSFDGETIVSSEDLSLVADLHPGPSGGWETPLTSHVESHAAARIRQHGLSDGVVVLNNGTCGTRGYDNDYPVTCDRLLPSILPPGATLTVWASEDAGETWWTKTYVGTGERIRP